MPLVSLLIIFIIFSCKGKEERQITEAPVIVEKNAETAEKESVPSAHKPNAINQPINTNAPPRITKFDVEPKKPIVGDTIKVISETSDKDEDSVKVIYEWAINDIALDIKSNVLTISDKFKRGDKISVKATPDDGKVKGMPLTMFMYIANAPPLLKSLPERIRLDGNLYTDQIKAIDPDGDHLTFVLKEAPDGMTIHPEIGFVRWKVPSQFVGKYNYTVSVTDGHGGETEAKIYIDFNSKLREKKP